MDEMRFIKRQEPDTPVRAYLALMSLGLFGRPGRSFGSGWLVLFWVSDTFWRFRFWLLKKPRPKRPGITVSDLGWT